MDSKSKNEPKTQPIHKKEIVHQGVVIGVYDYRELSIDEAICAMEHNAEVIESRREKNQRHILNVTGIKPNKTALKVCKKVAPAIEPYVNKTAVVGIPQIQHIFLNFLTSVFRLNIQAFEDVESAKKWLIE